MNSRNKHIDDRKTAKVYLERDLYYDVMTVANNEGKSFSKFVTMLINERLEKEPMLRLKTYKGVKK